MDGSCSDVRYSVLKEKLSSCESQSWKKPSEIQRDLSKSNEEKTIDELEMPIANRTNLDLDDNNLQSTMNTYNENEHVLISQPKDSVKKHTGSEKFLILIIVFLSCVIAIYTLILLNSLKHNNAQLINDLSKYCMTDTCMMLSSSIYKSINHEINPCEDFYEYTCGGWLKENLIPTGFPRWGTLSSITYRNQFLLKEQLETAKNITLAENKAKSFYKSCIDSNGLIEKLGSKPLMNILDDFMFKNNSTLRIEFKQSFQQILSMLQIKFGNNGLFELDVLDDDKNSSYNNIEITQGVLSLERELYLNKTEKNLKIMEIYKKTILSAIHALYGPVNNSKEIMEDIIELETKIAQILIPIEDLSKVESVYSRISLNDLNLKYARFLNWTELINNLLRKYNSTEHLENEDQIVVMGLDYLKGLDSLIAEYQNTSRKEQTLKMFVSLNFIKFCLPLLSAEYRNIFNALNEALTGTNNAERWQTCVEHTDNINGFSYALARMFIRKTPSDSKQMAQNIIKSIKKSFIANFPKIEWMDSETRTLAEDKVNSVEELISYPEFITNDLMLNSKYADLEINENDYFGNEIRLLQYALKNEIMSYRVKVQRDEWEMSPSAVNAYYSPTRNQIVFPSGILQEPFFHPSYPMSLNYGSIGSVMGHELAHGFDNSGREYDKYGTMKQWWNNRTIEDFEKASECIVDQYSKYSINGDYLNGRQTLGENIADNGGLRAAYNAYEEWIKENGEEKPLPIIKLSHRQLVFVSFAQNWCTKSTPDALRSSILSDLHSPPNMRVIGSISNSIEFSKAFKCPIDSKMNPRNKCVLW